MYLADLYEMIAKCSILYNITFQIVCSFFLESSGVGVAHSVRYSMERREYYQHLKNMRKWGKLQFFKTLFNIMEAWFEKLLNFGVCVVQWCWDGFNEQPGILKEYSFEIYAVIIEVSARATRVNEMS